MNYEIINGENFYPIVGFNKYLISHNGQVYSLYKKRLLSQHDAGLGYLQVWLTNQFGGKWYKVHRIMALTFIPNPENKSDVNHKDLNKANNHVSNLEWMTRSENIQHSFDNGRIMPKGKDHWNYGVKPSENTKKLMSQKKLGANHPKHLGKWITPAGSFESIRQAAFVNNISPGKVKRNCLSIHSKYKNWQFIPKNSLIS